jgi:putative transposase
MRFSHSIFASLLKPIDRREFATSVEQHGGDAYDKSFHSWDHLVALVFAQLAHVDSLRGLVAVWNANAHHHYHLGTEKLSKSTLSDANRRRPVAVFSETFMRLSRQAGRVLRREGAAMLRLLDATPVPLERLADGAGWNGRTHGLKLHMLYDPLADHPQRIDITPANINDITAAQAIPIERSGTYVFDKAYCDYRWWTRIHEAGSVFVTRRKRNARFVATRRRGLRKRVGDGFKVLDDAEVRLATQGRRKLAIPMRRIRIKRDDGGTLTLITNDLRQPAVEIAALYKGRWQIELLFRWLKQHLKLRKFIGRSENAIRLQIVAAMVAYLLLRIAAAQSRIGLTAIRFAELICDALFVRKPLARIDKPPEVNPSHRRTDPSQLEFCYA